MVVDGNDTVDTRELQHLRIEFCSVGLAVEFLEITFVASEFRFTKITRCAAILRAVVEIRFNQ